MPEEVTDTNKMNKQQIQPWSRRMFLRWGSVTKQTQSLEESKWGLQQLGLNWDTTAHYGERAQAGLNPNVTRDLTFGFELGHETCDFRGENLRVGIYRQMTAYFWGGVACFWEACIRRDGFWGVVRRKEGTGILWHVCCSFWTPLFFLPLWFEWVVQYIFVPCDYLYQRPWGYLNHIQIAHLLGETA